MCVVTRELLLQAKSAIMVNDKKKVQNQLAVATGNGTKNPLQL